MTNQKQQQIYDALKKFGLNPNETKVYLASLKEDELTPSKISKLTGIPRTTVYDILMGLSLKGLVRLEGSDGMTKQQTLVKANNPSVMRDILRQKRKELFSTEVDILHILSNIKTDFHREKANANFMFYPGIEGARKLYLDNLARDYVSVDLPTYAWDLQMPMDAFGMDMNKLITMDNEIRKKKKTPTKELIPLNDWSRHVMTYQYERDSSYLDNVEYRYIENSTFEVFMRIEIKGDRVLMICAHEDEVWGARIKSEAFSKTMQSIFEMNWAMAIPLTPEILKTWGPNEFLEVEKEKKSVTKKLKSKKKI